MHIGLGVAWLWAARQRREEIGRWRRGEGWRRRDEVEEEFKVSIVVPMKGEKEGVEENVLSHTQSAFKGRSELILAVEDESDPAAEIASRIKQRSHIPCTIVWSGPPEGSSHKAKAMVTGVDCASEDADFVLFHDDDAVSHPMVCTSLVNCFRRKTRPLLATGYPFDLPPATGGSILCHAILSYHAVLGIAFSQGEVSLHVWGGCMLLPGQLLKAPTSPARQRLLCGGYSDDLILASLAKELGMTIACPGSAVLPSPVPGSPGVASWWSFLRRQIFVLDTYASEVNKRVNRSLLVGLAALSSLATWPLLSLPIDLARSSPRRIAPLAISLGSVAFSTFSSMRMYRSLAALWRSFAPEGWWRHVDLSGLRPHKLALGVLTTFAAVPFVCVATLVKDDIVWGDIRYRKRRGSVTPIARA